jgi:hypothetical protein
MQRTKLFGTLVVALLAGVAACDRPEAGQDPQTAGAMDQMGPHLEMDPEVMQQIMEIQQLQQQLEPIQNQALQDEELAGQLAALQARIESTMRAQGADVFERIDRFEADMAAAEAAGDQERTQALMMEAQLLQQEVQALQAAVFERPEISQPVAEFEAAHRARVIAIDPGAEALLDRIEELMAKLPM